MPYLIHVIKWRGEEVDSFDTLEEARKMLAEYNMAYGGGCSLVARKRKKDD